MDFVTELLPIVESFNFGGRLIFAEPLGHGNINSTFVVYFSFISRPPKRFILQRINTDVFTDPLGLMENIRKITEFLRDKIISRGGDPKRETLTLVPSKDGRPFVRDESGGFWRAYEFIEFAKAYQTASIELFESSGRAFGRFQRMLYDFPANELVETIPNFHNTRIRFNNLMDAESLDSQGRKSSVLEELAFVKAREDFCPVLTYLLDKGLIPLGVTHNDTKLNNVLIDDHTGEGVCVVDLDTVMPGSPLYDFGDSIRFGANTAGEEEGDLSLVNFSLPLFEAYCRGFLPEARLCEAEIDHLPEAAILMTLECGIRFLEDFLRGDIYFKTRKGGHNLSRARTQFRLVAQMEENLPQIREIVRKFT